jgi:hypothetical protein
MYPVCTPKPRLDIYRSLNRSLNARSLNALAESVIGLFKTEEIRRRGSWKGLEDVEFATLEWVAWYNGSRLLEPLGYVPPAEFETLPRPSGRTRRHGSSDATESLENPARFSS